MKKRSQNTRVIDHLTRFKGITSWQAITKYRITRLASRISDLRGDGYRIESELVTDNGQRYARYWLARP